MGQNYCIDHKLVLPPSTVPLLVLLVSVTLCSVQKGQALSVLVSTFFLSGNQYLMASDYYLVMQTDCDLVLYDGPQAVLSSHTSGRGKNCSLKMQQDGNIEIHNSTRSSSVPALWSSQTSTSVPDQFYFFVLGSNGSLGIYDFGNTVVAIGDLSRTLSAFSSGTAYNFSRYPYDPLLAWKPSTPIDAIPYMPVGYFLDEGCSLQSSTKQFNITLGYDCNLQSKELLQNGSSRTLWETKTTSFGPGHQCRLTLQENGNLQLQSADWRLSNPPNLVWASNVTGDVAVQWALIMNYERGEVIICDLLNPANILWSTVNLPKASQAKKKKKVSITELLIGLTAASFILAMAAVSLTYYFCASARIDEAEKELQRRLGSNKRKCHSLTPATIKQATRNFEIKIGHGGFGDVFYGKLASGQEIAVKVMSAKSHQSKQEFYNEVELLTIVHHKYLVALVGYCLARNRCMLVYENMSGGDLRRRLQGAGTAKNPLAWKERTAIILQIAEGIEYLHNKCSPAIIHRDIKSNNILLTKDLVAKIADFGLSKLRAFDQEATTHVTTLVKGTPGYLDPEYHETGMLTEKSDVYAFGIVLMEILTGQHHYCLVEKVHEAWSLKELEDLSDPYLMCDYDNDDFSKLVQLSLSCTSRKATDRPSMAVIVHLLQEINLIKISEPHKCDIEDRSVPSETAYTDNYEAGINTILPVAESSSNGSLRFSVASLQNEFKVTYM